MGQITRKVAPIQHENVSRTSQISRISAMEMRSTSLIQQLHGDREGVDGDAIEFRCIG